MLAVPTAHLKVFCRMTDTRVSLPLPFGDSCSRSAVTLSGVASSRNRGVGSYSLVRFSVCLVAFGPTFEFEKTSLRPGVWWDWHRQSTLAIPVWQGVSW
jgi:hypothetical protein